LKVGGYWSVVRRELRLVRGIELFGVNADRLPQRMRRSQRKRLMRKRR